MGIAAAAAFQQSGVDPRLINLNDEPSLMQHQQVNKSLRSAQGGVTRHYVSMITWKPSVLFPHHVNTLSVVADNNPTQGSTQRGSLFVPLVLSLAKG